MSLFSRILGIRYICKAIRNSSTKRADPPAKFVSRKSTNQNLRLLQLYRRYHGSINIGLKFIDNIFCNESPENAQLYAQIQKALR